METNRLTPVREQYNTDIEMVMDFMKLSLLFDGKDTTDTNKLHILALQKNILDIIPVAQSNRMTAINKILEPIYHMNMSEYNRVQKLNQLSNQSNKINNPIKGGDKNINSNKENQYIIMFHRSSCQACKKIWKKWTEFKNQNMDSDFTILEYDADVRTTLIKEKYEQFKIEYVPTVIKLNGKGDKEILVGNVTKNNLRIFADFN